MAQINPIGNLKGNLTGLVGNIYGALNKKGSHKHELEKLANAALSEMDFDWDNVFSESEFQAFCQKNGLTEGTLPTGRDKKIASLFQKIDTDGNGKVDQKEWDIFQDKLQRFQQIMADKLARAGGVPS